MDKTQKRAVLLGGPEFSPGPVTRCAVFTEMARMLRDYWIDWQAVALHDQLCLAVPEPTMLDTMSHKDQLGLGTGRLDGQWKDRDFKHLVRGAEFIQPLLEYAWSYGYYPSRPMIRYLAPKRCLSYHRDDARIRFHLVLDTHENAMFVVNDIVYRMPEPGALYTLRTDHLHTAINADLTRPRIHFTFSGYKDNAA